jgi:hypothetical protein
LGLKKVLFTTKGDWKRPLINFERVIMNFLGFGFKCTSLLFSLFSTGTLLSAIADSAYSAPSPPIIIINGNQLTFPECFYPLLNLDPSTQKCLLIAGTFGDFVIQNFSGFDPARVVVTDTDGVDKLLITGMVFKGIGTNIITASAQFAAPPGPTELGGFGIDGEVSIINNTPGGTSSFKSVNILNGQYTLESPTFLNSTFPSNRRFFYEGELRPVVLGDINTITTTLTIVQNGPDDSIQLRGSNEAAISAPEPSFSLTLLGLGTSILGLSCIKKIKNRQ